MQTPLQAAELEYLLRKPVNTLAIVPKSEKITLTARKIYNVMLHHAQRQGVAQDVYRVPFKAIATGIDFHSNNTEVIKQYFRQMATTGVEWQSPTTGEGIRWSVSALIAHAALIKQGNELLLEWSYAPNIKHELLDPQRFAKMSLQVQAELNTMPALALYEICCRYVDNPGGLTARQSWAWWRPVLTGSPDSAAAAYLEYKIFNRDVLKKATKKVNQVSDLEIELIEHKQGRAVQDLQFRVRRKTPLRVAQDHAIAPVDLKTIGAAIKAGVAQDRAERILAKYGARALDEALAAMGQRHEQPNLDPVRSPEKYLLTLLESGQFGELKAPAAVAPKRPYDSKVQRLKLIEQFFAGKRAELNAMFQEMSESEQQAWIGRFADEGLPNNDAVKKTFLRKGIASPIVRPVFLKYLGNAVWEEGWDKPSDTDLVEVAMRSEANSQ
ncbi:MAG: replication initiation protein [Herminiimonas sp.]|nr:replication initiation protein [Herminiimonas sp.]